MSGGDGQAPCHTHTSLNFSGGGFINRTSDLYSYRKDRRIDAFVYEGRFCTIRQ